jgi:sterol desaturase/sphingolipid hydroxylase (fatty acid hydroxylase superfamily)
MASGSCSYFRIAITADQQRQMTFFKLEHTKAFYYADFVAYIFVIVLVSGLLIGYAPRGAWLAIVMSVAGGLALWPLIEYALHRYVLHGLEPFRGWHMEHHNRPRAFIGTPTIFSAGLIFTLVFLPASASANVWVGTGLTLGVTIGYLAFSWTHHAVHYWRADTRWLRNRKRLHNIHHRPGSACNYGVTTSFLDALFGTRAG